ncbi:general secretion pathway protein GspK, partial [Escherichia coli]|uniref:general secretion pathway protein GspK n=2 Tax=Enterobacteriaceae TaxID=543 RepID=UPI001C7008D7
VDAIADYVDNDDIPRASGAENEYYQTSNDPHTIGGRRIWSISELKQIKGMTLSLYQQISPLLCALPDDELKININTLTRRDAPLLAAMINNAVPPREIERFFDTPRKGRKISTETLLKTFDKDNPAHKLSQSTFKSIAVATSRYFRLETTIEQ